MRLRDLYKINSRRGLLVSILFHVILFTGLVTATVLTTPEGVVLSDEIEFSNAGSGEPIPIEVTPALPKGREEAKAEKTVELPKKEEIIETQKVDAPKVVAKATPKTWKPVEETDVDDTAAGTLPSSDEEKTPPPEQADEKQADVKEEVAAGIPEGGETTILPPGGNGEDEGTGSVQNEKNLQQAAGNPKITYPYLSRLTREEGVVTVRFTLHPDGSLNKVWIHQSSVSKALDERVLVFAKWKYQKGAEGVFEKKLIFKLVGPAEQAPFRQ